MLNAADREIRLKGISASPGICIGKAYLVGNEGVDIVKKYYICKKNIDDEVRRFKVAVKHAIDELRTLFENTPEDLRRQAYILETHLLLLKDKMLYDTTIETIKREQVNAEWALKKVVQTLESSFQNMRDTYLKERAADILHVSERIMRNLVGAKIENIADIDKQVILIATDLSPAETSQIQLERIKGFVTDRGGKGSHTGIIAQGLEIPAVIGAEKATSLIENDNIILVDGSSGVVVVNPSEKTLVEFSERQISYERYKAGIRRESHFPAETRDGFSLKIMGNIELPEEVVSVIDNGGDGVGLYRTEFQYLSRTNFPSEYELFDKYKDVVEVMAPNPVTIRTLDINGDKAVSYTSEIYEANPALGLRAIRYCFKKPDVFNIQLRAILKAASFGNVRIMFPMISSCEEIIEAIRILDKTADSLDKEGIVFNRDIKIGIMLEVPSAVIMADALAKHVDFFSIGTNDLIQYSLAIDRENRYVSYLYHPVSPAIIRMIKHIVDVADDQGVKLSTCGEMAGDLYYIPILLGLGIKELSMNPRSMPAAKSLIRSLSIEEAKLFTKDVLRQTTASGIMKLVVDRYGGVISEKTYT
ncbi:MAG: phosphoenolpyruvate--protein phosphotransferase [Deltaproteobacteria bacterium]|nr:MAG: phosphoenolpyruvate--protein phosphotransferase [Deltaproteobacteria bacterium]